MERYKTRDDRKAANLSYHKNNSLNNSVEGSDAMLKEGKKVAMTVQNSKSKLASDLKTQQVK